MNQPLVQISRQLWICGFWPKFEGFEGLGIRSCNVIRTLDPINKGIGNQF